MSECGSAKEIEINVVLEESRCNGLNEQTVRMVGFVIINDVNIKLSDLRLKIIEQFDDDQLQIIGLNFKFVKKTFPVSSKQESIIQIKKICINVSNTNNTNQSDINDITFQLQPQSSPLQQQQDGNNTDIISNESSKPTTNNNSLIIVHEIDEKANNHKQDDMNNKGDGNSFNMDPMQPYDVLPHHYQYMSSHLGITSPLTAAATMYPAKNNTLNTNTNTNNNNNKSSEIQNECTFPKVTVYTTNPTTPISQIKKRSHHSFPIEREELEYTIMVRACHSVLRRSSSDDNVALHCLLDTDNNNNNNNNNNGMNGNSSLSSSMSVFTSFNLKNNDDDVVNNNKYEKKTASNSSSLPSLHGNNLKSPLVVKHNDNKIVNLPKLDDMNSYNQTEHSFTASFIASHPISPKSTRLETKLGQKLPRIQSKSSKIFTPSNEVDSILKNAMRSAKNELNIITTNKLDEEDEREYSISISVNESTKLKPMNIENNNNNNYNTKLKRPNCSIVPLKLESEGHGDRTLSTPPHTFLYSNTIRNAGEYIDNAVNGSILIDDKIKCKLTVIGSPILDDDKMDDEKVNNNGNVIWEFDSAEQLIKGLSGVHHSEHNPLWIDLICDRNTFIHIAEHIRPLIHNLTIEDCLTIDCREKLEIFNDYLFICLSASSSTNDHNQSMNIPRINILIFKTMIITYHLGCDITNRLIFDCRFILNKKFNNMCPSPSWVCHTIIDNVIDKMMPCVESTVREVETIEQFVFKLCNESQNELLHRMQIARAWMVLYRSRLWPKSTITHNLLNNIVWRKDFLSDVPQPYWRDINDHVARMVDLLELGTQTLESIQNMFVAKISLEMNQQSNNLAKVGGKLAGVGAIFLPLTVITGLWGMNCKVPFQLHENSNLPLHDDLFGFIIVLLVMVISSILTWQFVKKKGLE